MKNNLFILTDKIDIEDIIMDDIISRLTIDREYFEVPTSPYRSNEVVNVTISHIHNPSTIMYDKKLKFNIYDSADSIEGIDIDITNNGKILQCNIVFRKD